MVSDTANTTRMTGAEAIVASLEALGVTVWPMVALEADADGWVARSWAGRALA